MHRSVGSRIHKCEYCNNDVNIDAEPYCSPLLIDGLTGKTKKRLYVHESCYKDHELKALLEQVLKAQKDNV